MKYIFFLFPIFLQAQCLIPTHSYRLICADEVRYADSISSGSRLYISSRNAFVTSPRSVFNLVNGYGQHFIQITNSANSQKVAINRAWINRIDSTSSNKALIYIKDINVTFTTVESYSAVKDSAIACFVRAVASGLATLSDGDYGDVVVSGGGLVMTVDKPDLGLHNLADGDFSVVADSTALSLTNTRAITLQTKNIDGWISRYLQTNNSLTLRTNNTTKTSRIFVDTTGANFQFVNGANNASLRIGDSVAVRFNTSGSVGQVLTVTSVDGDGRLVINPKTGGSGTANCEQTLTKTSHGFRKWTPIYWNGSAWARPTFDSIIPTYIVVDSTTVDTFKVSNCGNYSSSLTAGIYYYTGTSPGYTLTQPEIKVPLFEVAQARLILQPLVGFSLAGGSGSGDVTRDELADSTAAIRADFPSGVTDGDKGEITVTSGVWTIDNNAITSAKIASQTVDSLGLKNRVITNVKLADNAVTTDKIQDATITTADLSFQVPTVSRIMNYNQNATFDSRFLVYLSCIVRPTNSYVLHDTIDWDFLPGDPNHDYIFATSANGTAAQLLEVNYPTVRRIINITANSDDTFTGLGISCGVSGQNSKLILTAMRSTPFGAELTGNGSTGYTTLTNHALLLDHNTGTGLTRFTLNGGSHNYTNYSTIFVVYQGNGNYHIRRVYSGLSGYSAGFYLVDNTTNAIVTGAPATTDRVVISGGGIIAPRPYPLLTFTAENTQLGAPSFVNFWINGVFEAWMVASPISTTSMLVRWQPSWPSATTYKIYRDTNSDFSTQVLIHTGTLGTYTDTGLTTNTLYYYKMVAVVGGLDVNVTTFSTRTE